MIMITRGDLGRLCPRPRAGAKQAIWDGYASALERMGPELVSAGIDTPLKLCHALAQWGAETGFTLLWESGNYSAPRILEMFGKGKHSAAVSAREAEQIAALPTANDARGKALFERVYGLGNPKKARELGNTEPGDGWKYRGFGIQQVTGGTDHVRYFRGEYSYESAIRGALLEWQNKGCSGKAALDDCKGVTRLINGGYNGLSERETLLRQAKLIWLDADEAEAAEADDVPPPRLPDTLMAAPAESMGNSKIGNTQGLVGAGSAYVAVGEVSTATQAASASGRFVFTTFALHLLSSQAFMLAVFTLATAAATWFWRHQNLNATKPKP